MHCCSGRRYILDIYFHIFLWNRLKYFKKIFTVQCTCDDRNHRCILFTCHTSLFYSSADCSLSYKLYRMFFFRKTCSTVLLHLFPALQQISYVHAQCNERTTHAQDLAKKSTRIYLSAGINSKGALLYIYINKVSPC